MALKVESKDWYRKELIRLLQKSAANKTDMELIFLNRLYPSEEEYVHVFSRTAFLAGRIYQRLNDLKKGHLKLKDENGRWL